MDIDPCYTWRPLEDGNILFFKTIFVSVLYTLLCEEVFRQNEHTLSDTPVIYGPWIQNSMSTSGF